MTLIVCYVQVELDKIECIYFLNAILIREFGITYRLTGLWLQSLLLESLFHGSGYGGLLEYLETKKWFNF
jgi:hypothetical protein